MAIVEAFDGINSEDYIDPNNDEYVSVALAEVQKLIPTLKLRPLIKRVCFKYIKQHNLQLEAYYPKVNNRYQITALGLIQTAELIINPKLGFAKTIEFLTDTKVLIETKTRNINHAYNQKVAMNTQSVSEIVSDYFPDKDPVWLNKQLKKLGWIIHHRGNQWEITDNIADKGYAQNVSYYGSHYVRYTPTGVNEIVRTLSSSS